MRAWPSSVAAAMGWLWGGAPQAVAFTPLVFAAWWAARSRREAFAVAVLYHACAGRHLALGAARYLEVGMLPASVCIVLGASLVALVWAACWSAAGREESPSRASLRVLCLAGLTYAPGVGVFAIASPLCAAGVWWPGAGWVGLVGWVALVQATRRAAGIALVVMFAATGAVRWQGAAIAPLGAVETQVAPARGLVDFEQQWHVARASIDAARAEDARIVVLPESAAGLWQGPMTRLWKPLAAEFRAAGRVALVGAAMERSDGRFDNVALVLGAEMSPYRQRAPVPFAMWRPGVRGSFAAHWFEQGTLRVQGHRLGMLICWEAALVWPVFRSVAEGAEALVVMANGAWLPAGAVGAMKQTVQAWGALFGLPVAMAVNT